MRHLLYALVIRGDYKMKMDIEWHEECLKNRLNFASRKKDHLLRLEAEIETDDQANGLYAAQIDLAKQEGKDGFDLDKYAIKRLCV